MKLIIWAIPYVFEKCGISEGKPFDYDETSRLVQLIPNIVHTTLRPISRAYVNRRFNTSLDNSDIKIKRFSNFAVNSTLSATARAFSRRFISKNIKKKKKSDWLAPPRVAIIVFARTRYTRHTSTSTMLVVALKERRKKKFSTKKDGVLSLAVAMGRTFGMCAIYTTEMY